MASTWGAASRAPPRAAAPKRGPTAGAIRTANLSAPSILGASGAWADAGALGLVAIGDASPVHVVGRHLNRDPVAHHGADAVFFHHACGVGQDLVVVLKAHSEAAFGQEFNDLAIELDEIFFRHCGSL